MVHMEDRRSRVHSLSPLGVILLVVVVVVVVCFGVTRSSCSASSQSQTRRVSHSSTRRVPCAIDHTTPTPLPCSSHLNTFVVVALSRAWRRVELGTDGGRQMDRRGRIRAASRPNRRLRH